MVCAGDSISDGGCMVYVPFLRYSYYDQMVMLFSEYKSVASAAT